MSREDGLAPEPQELESLVARCLQRIDDEGADALEAMCREHPEHADALRAKVVELRAAGLVAGTESGSRADDSAGERPERIGPYRILDVLGEGGMGTVYLAEQKEPVRRRVALKVIKLGMDSKQVLARFEAERQALAMMNHDCIARVFDAGTTERGQPYFVMEHVAGLPITEHCDRHRLSTKERLVLFQQVCAGVQHAHQKGVIHRDLKPTNVLVSVEQGTAVPKIIDFGLARATDHRLVEATIYTEQGQVIGTPEYMSPEQAEMTSQDIDTRTDVYSLGVMLYELLVGELPFSPQELRKAGLLEIQRKIREDEPPKPSTRLSSLGAGSEAAAHKRRTTVASLSKELKGDLDWVVMMSIEKERSRRYVTAQAFAEDLARYLRHDPVDARPPSAAYRAKKFLRRYRTLVSATVAVLVATAAGFVVSTILYLETDAALERTKARLAREIELRKIAAEQIGELAASALETSRALAKPYIDTSFGGPSRSRVPEEPAGPSGSEASLAFELMARVAEVDGAIDEASRLYPAWPENAAAIERWLEEHGVPLERLLPDLRESLARQRSGAGADDDGREGQAVPSTVFDMIEKAVPGLERLGDPETGLLADIRKRLYWAERVEQLTVGRHEARWSQARAAILLADGVTASELYRDPAIDLEPQMGLVPIGMNPVTKLWEFYHLRSAWDPREGGDPSGVDLPEHREDGSIAVSDDTGIFFVLIPGGTFAMGAQASDEHGPNYDRRARADESPIRHVDVEPYFLARHELTQGQWMRLGDGSNPSRYSERAGIARRPITLAHPVEQVDWTVGRELLRQHGLELPSEVQWEFACRARAETPWHTGEEPETLEGFANVFDEAAKKGSPWSGEPHFLDGYVLHAPVGSFRPNDFGLYDMHGNVWEWCRDRYSAASIARVRRGGGFRTSADAARSASRERSTPGALFLSTDLVVGVRAARALIDR